jgi:hypothetical protein
MVTNNHNTKGYGIISRTLFLFCKWKNKMTEKLPAIIHSIDNRIAKASTINEIKAIKIEIAKYLDDEKRTERLVKAKKASEEAKQELYFIRAELIKRKMMADIRIADEYDAAQCRGEVAGHGGARNFKVAACDLEKITLTDVNLTKQEIYDARQARNAEKIKPGITNEILVQQIKKDRSPTEAELRRAYRTAIENKEREEQKAKESILHFLVNLIEKPKTISEENSKNEIIYDETVNADSEEQNNGNTEDNTEEQNPYEEITEETIKWNMDLPVTEAEQEEIKFKARKADMSFGQFIIYGLRKAGILSKNISEEFSLSMQQKFELAVKQTQKRLEKDYEIKMRTEIDSWLKDTIQPLYAKKLDSADRIIKARNGAITKETFRSILSCLHPDRVNDDKVKERFAKAFYVFKELDIILCNEKEMPTVDSGMPNTPAEWYKRRKEMKEKRKNQNKSLI